MHKTKEQKKRHVNPNTPKSIATNHRANIGTRRRTSSFGTSGPPNGISNGQQDVKTDRCALHDTGEVR
ncbi:hypothetical protein TSMEX_004559 [Taenia solium]|eukprot:TsM_000338900 transcript=TsM_000338900 gene=TsM_000338900